jgi:hypothetical protein
LLPLVLILPVLAQQGAAPTGEWRQWTLDGKTKIEAAMRGVDSGNVILLSRDGRAATLPLARIGTADRAYVRSAIGGLVMAAVERANAGAAVPASLGAAGAPAARSGWQGGVKADPANCEVTDVSVSDSDWKQAFRSRHFEFSGNSNLPVERQRDVARLFEVQFELHRRAGWGVGPTLEGGGRMKVQLFDTDAAFAAAGALPLSGCDLDYETGILRCTLEAAGVHLIEGVWLADSVLTPKAVARGVTLKVLSDALETLPLWVLNGVAACMEAIPVTSGVAWPDRASRLVKPHVERAGGIHELDFASLLALPEPPSSSPRGVVSIPGGGTAQAVPSRSDPANREALAVEDSEVVARRKMREFASSAMLAYYFVFLEQGGHASRLAGLVAAARADEEKWAAYDRALEEYKKEWAAIKARKDVVDQGGGKYFIPSSVIVPKSPVPPNEQRATEQTRRIHIPKLLGGVAPAEAAEAAKLALKGAGF